MQLPLSDLTLSLFLCESESFLWLRFQKIRGSKSREFWLPGERGRRQAFSVDKLNQSQKLSRTNFRPLVGRLGDTQSL